ncbi:type II toxin-antitoxin system VapC family toxin [Scytonema sp. NUACC26]|uniref:type II toxin-antitoxin system VapC family toxin n=1 Tax=Scytonema sp. NUACC26 TaxID=3140176 RepID=UPI0034DBAF6F
MTIVLLDSSPLGLITNPRKNSTAIKCRRLIQELVKNKILVAVPEIIDYELRRELILSGSDGVERLDRLGELGLAYAPLTTEVMRKAAELWVWARKTGQPTAHKEKIDIDVILAAHSIVLSLETGKHTIIATSDSDHKRYKVDAVKWEDLTVEYCLNPIASKIPLRKSEQN